MTVGTKSRGTLIGLLGLSLAFGGCSSDDSPGTTDAAATGGSGGGADGSSGGSGDGAADAGPGPDASPDGPTTVTLKPFTPPPANPPAGSALISASGEALAQTGYGFPPATMDDPAFVDGWEIRFQHMIFTLGNVRYSLNPDKAPGDQSQTDDVVASAAGPWAIDLSVDAPANIAGKGDPGERAVPITVIPNQNQKGGDPFLMDGTRYAFSYDVIAATDQSQNANLGPEGLQEYAKMIADGCAVLYVGTATFNGGAMCTPADPEFAKLPPKVDFHLCFKTPTSYLNCQNGDNDPAMPFADEAHQRGVAFKSNNAFLVSQVTMHTDHPFWDSTKHDVPSHFDQFAARAKPGVGSANALVTLEDMKGVDFTAFTDTAGNKLPFRKCLASYTPPAAGQMFFDPVAVPKAPMAGDPAQGLRDYYDFSSYNQSTQGHLNVEDGLCAVKRNYASPP